MTGDFYRNDIIRFDLAVYTNSFKVNIMRVTKSLVLKSFYSVHLQQQNLLNMLRVLVENKIPIIRF